MKSIHKFLCVFVFILALAGCQSFSTPDCGRACITMQVNNYVRAMVNNQTENLPLSEDYRLTENGIDKKVGHGVWQTITEQESYAQIFVDQSFEQAVFFGAFKEGQEPLLMAIRFKFDDGEITEIENLTSRFDQRNRLISRSQLKEANPIYERIAIGANQLSKKELIVAGHAYFDGIAKSTDDGVPMHRECIRRENGVVLLQNKNPQTEPCPIGFHRFNYITDVRDRRVAVVDQERNLILMFAVFDIPGNIEVDPRPIGPSDLPQPAGTPRVDSRKIPRSLYIAELFRLEDGLIRDIDAIMFNEDFGFKPNW